MASTDLYPRFGEEEIARRHELVRSFLAESDLDALVVFGWSAQNRTAQADVYYLSGYLGMRDNYVIFPRVGEPTLFAQSYNHVPNAAQVSFLDDVRWGGADNGVTVGEDLLARSLGEVGVVGWMPYQQYESMRKTTGDLCSFRDVTREFRTIRLKKSDEELEWLNRGAAFTDAALAGLRDALVPGVKEYELAEAIEHSYLGAGGLTTFYYIASTPMSDPDRCVPAQVLSNREIQAGDVVTCELSASYAGYAGQGLRTYTVSQEPTSQIADLHAVAEDVYHKVAAAIRTGASVEEVWDASEAVSERGVQHQRRPGARLWHRSVASVDPHQANYPGARRRLALRGRPDGGDPAQRHHHGRNRWGTGGRAVRGHRRRGSLAAFLPTAAHQGGLTGLSMLSAAGRRGES